MGPSPGEGSGNRQRRSWHVQRRHEVGPGWRRAASLLALPLALLALAVVVYWSWRPWLRTRIYFVATAASSAAPQDLADLPFSAEDVDGLRRNAADIPSWQVVSLADLFDRSDTSPAPVRAGRDLVVVYLAAPGQVVRDEQGMSPTPYLVGLAETAVDGRDASRGLALEDLLARLKRIPARHKLLLLDTGTFRPHPFGSPQFDEFALVAESIVKAAGDDSLWVLLSRSPFESSRTSGRDHRSLFSLAVQEGLAGRADQATSADRRVDLEELQAYVASRLGEWSGEAEFSQTPVLWRASASAPNVAETRRTVVLAWHKPLAPAEPEKAPAPADPPPATRAADALPAEQEKTAKIADVSQPADRQPRPDSPRPAPAGVDSVADRSDGKDAGSNSPTATESPQTPSSAALGAPPPVATLPATAAPDSGRPKTGEAARAERPHEELSRRLARELDEAWTLRDKLEQLESRATAGGGATGTPRWSPVDFSPQAWRRVNERLLELERRLRAAPTRNDFDRAVQLKDSLSRLDRALVNDVPDPIGKYDEDFEQLMLEFDAYSKTWRTTPPRARAALGTWRALRVSADFAFHLRDYLELLHPSRQQPGYESAMDALQVAVDRFRDFQAEIVARDAVNDEFLPLDAERERKLVDLADKLWNARGELDDKLESRRGAGPPSALESQRCESLLASCLTRADIRSSLRSSREFPDPMARPVRDGAGPESPEKEGQEKRRGTKDFAAVTRLEVRDKFWDAQTRWTDRQLEIVRIPSLELASEGRGVRTEAADFDAAFGAARRLEQALQSLSATAGSTSARRLPGWWHRRRTLFSSSRLVAPQDVAAGESQLRIPFDITAPGRNVEFAEYPPKLTLSFEDQGFTLALHRGDPELKAVDVLFEGDPNLFVLTRASGIETEKPGWPRKFTYTFPDGDRQAVDWKIRALRHGSSQTPLRITVLASSRQEIEIPCKLPMQDRIELLARWAPDQDPPRRETELVPAGEAAQSLRPFPNRPTRFELRLRNHSGRPLKVRAQLLACPTITEEIRVGPPGRLVESVRTETERTSRVVPSYRAQVLRAPGDWTDTFLAQRSRLLVGEATLDLPERHDEGTALTFVPPTAPMSPGAKPGSDPPPPVAPAVNCSDGLLLLVDEIAEGSARRAAFVKWIELVPRPPWEIFDLTTCQFKNGRVDVKLQLRDLNHRDARDRGDERDLQDLGVTAESRLEAFWSIGGTPLEGLAKKGVWDSLPGPAGKTSLEFFAEEVAENPDEKAIVRLRVDGYPRAFVSQLPLTSPATGVELKGAGSVALNGLHLERIRLDAGPTVYRFPPAADSPFFDRVVTAVEDDKVNEVTWDEATDEASFHPAFRVERKNPPRELSIGWQVDFRETTEGWDQPRVRVTLGKEAWQRRFFGSRSVASTARIEDGRLVVHSTVEDFQTRIPLAATLDENLGGSQAIGLQLEGLAPAVNAYSRRTVERVVVLDTSPPDVSAVRTSDGRVKVPAGAPLTLTADVRDKESGVSRVDFQIGPLDPLTKKIAASTPPRKAEKLPEAHAYGLEFPTTGWPEGTYQVKVIATDRVGWSREVEAFELTVTTPPKPIAKVKDKPDFGTAPKPLLPLVPPPMPLPKP